jgi:rSAM/selenodomain-associated transferase 1
VTAITVKQAMAPVRIVIFAKAPLAGFAKTRLIPQLGAEGAAALARQLLRHTVTQALAADSGPVELCVTPNQQHAIWPTLHLPQAVTFSAQGRGDLGQRMARAARRSILKDKPVLLIGTDCPQLDSTMLQAAAQALAGHDCCLVPAHDGGYTLLGLRRHHPSLFNNIPWSTAEVARITRERIHALGWSLADFPAVHDIDEPADLAWLPVGWCDADRDGPRPPESKQITEHHLSTE